MIIKKVIIKDFFRYYGIQEIDCEISKERNVIVIIGENGRGKTTLLSAFNWVFYNEVIKPLTLSNILNYRALKELEGGKHVEVYVSIIFEEDSKEYKLTRKLEFTKDFTGKLNSNNNKSKVELVRVEKNGDETILDTTVALEKLLIPKDLRGFFFFDGEHISRLAKVDGKKEIKKAILNVLGISYLDQSNRDLEAIKKKLMDKLRRYNNSTPNEVKISSAYNMVLIEVEDLKKNIINIEKKIGEGNKQLECLREIINKSDNKFIKELEEKNVLLKSNRLEKSKDLILKEKEIKKHITMNFKYYLLFQSITNIEKILDQKKNEGQLPSNIKDTFIDDILKKGICICGTCLKNGSSEYESIVALKEHAGTRALDDAYYDLKALISKIKYEHENFYKILNEMISDRENLKNNIYVINEELRSISEKLKDTQVEDIKGVEEAREILESEIKDLTKKLGGLEDKLKEKEVEFSNLENQLKTVKSNNNEIIQLKQKVNIIEKLLNLNDDFKCMFIEVVREELDLRIKSVFSSITNKEYRVPVLTNDFELKITSTLNDIDLDDNDKKEEVLSTGEGQITSLSFIGALVSYAKDTKDDKILSKFTGEDYPIVMDSPFGNLDEIHTRNVAANIWKLSSQIIIVVSKKQWEGYVEENIKDQVIRTFIMTDGDNINNTGEYTIIEMEDTLNEHIC